MLGRFPQLLRAVLPVVLWAVHASSAFAATDTDLTEFQGFWIAAGFTADSHNDPNDRNGFSPADARNAAGGIAAAVSAEFPLPRPTDFLGRLLGPLFPGSARLEAGLEYYPWAAKDRQAVSRSPGGSPILQRGAGGKLLLTAAIVGRTRMSSEPRFHPFGEFGLGAATVRGGAREDVDSATGEVLGRDDGITGGGILVEAGFGLLRRRTAHDYYVLFRGRGYSDFITGGTSLQLVFGVSSLGLAER